MNSYHSDPIIPQLPTEVPSSEAPSNEDSLLSPIPLPGPIEKISPFLFRSLRAGCYYLSYLPTGFAVTRYYGTLRVEKPTTTSTTASGDLYRYQTLALPGTLVPSPPAPSSEVPIFPLSRYNSYLRITQILEGYTLGSGFTLKFERYTFNAATKTWSAPVAYSAVMSWAPAPAGYSSDFLTGQVKDAANNIVATLNLGWVSPYLRRAVVEIDTVPGSEAPLNNAAGIAWQTVGNQIGWKIDAYCSSTNVVPPSGDSWSDAEMHAGMLTKRDSADLNNTWRYHILAVRRIDSTPRGIMYDAGGTDSDNIPREGIGISSHWMIPNTSDWGLVAGQRFGAAAKPYFRTALHEIGHAMSLYHNTVNNGIMNTTDVISASATPANPFPNNILWSHAANDQKRLRHRPDIYIRPGGTAFGTAVDTPLSPDDEAMDAPGLEVQVHPLIDNVPLGAPVRVEVVLKNNGEHPVMVPAKLSLKTDFLTGSVKGPTGDIRTFSKIVYCIEDHELVKLAPGKKISGSLTLLRGAEGALFPVASTHEITVNVGWEIEGREVIVSGSASVMITPIQNESHATAAHKVLCTPDAHLVLALGGDHLKAGIAAVHAALADATLRPHFAYTEARRVGTRFMKRPADTNAAANLLVHAVVSRKEIEKAADFLKDGKSPEVKKAATALHASGVRLQANDEALQKLNAL